MSGAILLTVLLTLQPSPGRSGTDPDPLVTVEPGQADTDSPSVSRDSLAEAPLPATVPAASSGTYGTRSPMGALMRSAAIPGWGQFYNDRPVKGILLGAVELGLLALFLKEYSVAEDAREDFLESGDPLDEERYETHRERRLNLIWITAASWLYGMMDAYVDAHLFAFEEENSVFGREAGIGVSVLVRF